jgi:hypothetical protein
MAELLAWLQERLALQWVHAEPGESPAPAPRLLPPPAEALRALDELVRLGYLRGIQKKLDAIDADHPASVAFVANLRALARGFQLDTLAHLIAAALADAAVTTPKETTDAP